MHVHPPPVWAQNMMPPPGPMARPKPQSNPLELSEIFGNAPKLLSPSDFS